MDKQQQNGSGEKIEDITTNNNNNNINDKVSWLVDAGPYSISTSWDSMAFKIIFYGL